MPDGQNDVCRSCTPLDDDDPAVEYRGGWHSTTDPNALGGSYHRRTGTSANGKPKPAAAVTFTGDTITYFYAKSKNGGTANIYLDGVLRETLSYFSLSHIPTFGHAVTYSGLGAGAHELRIEHLTGAVFVDAFEFCGGGGPNPTPSSSARSRRSASTRWRRS